MVAEVVLVVEGAGVEGVNEDGGVVAPRLVGSGDDP